MSRRSLIALVVGLLVLAPLALVGVAVWMGGDDDSRVTGAIVARADEFERNYGMRLFTDAQGSPQPLGPLHSMTGCATKAGVDSPGPGADGVSRKQISGAVTYTTCRLVFDPSAMQPAFYTLLDDVLTRKTGRRGFWIVLNNLNGTTKPDGIHIQSALVGLGLPQLDGEADDEPVQLELILQPQSVSEVKNCCSGFTGGGIPSGWTPTQRPLSNRFVVTISNLVADQDTVKVDEWTASQKAFGSSIGIELSDLELTVARHATGDFNQWFTDFVTNGNNSPANKRTMTLALKKQNGDTGLTLTFTGVGIRGRESLGLNTQGAGTTLQDRFTLFVEEATWTVGAAQLPPPPPVQTTTPPPPPPPTTTTSPPPPVTAPPPPAPAPLAAPETLKFELLDKGQVRLTWTPVEGAESYAILSSSKPGGVYEPVAESTGTEHTLSGLAAGTTVYIVVRAAQGKEQSQNSKELAIPVE